MLARGASSLVQASPLIAAAAPSLLRVLRTLHQQPFTTMFGSQEAATSSGPTTSAQDLKEHAATLQDRLCDLHARYSETAAQPQAVELRADWHHTWQQQVRQVSATQSQLRRKGVTLGAAATLSQVKAATDDLETSLSAV